MTAPYYADDFVTLYHGDCIALAEAWGGADVLVTDPPYGMRYVPRGTYHARTGKTERSSLSSVRGDESTEARDAALALWGDKPKIVFGTFGVGYPFRVDHRLIWWKKGQAPGPARAAFMKQDEEIYVTGRGWLTSSPPQRSVIESSEPRSLEVSRIGHPTPKPVGLMETLVERCRPEWVVADPFAGSGSTLIAARNLGRKAVGVELEERYCEIIAKRLSQQEFDFSGLGDL